MPAASCLVPPRTTLQRRRRLQRAVDGMAQARQPPGARDDTTGAGRADL